MFNNIRNKILIPVVGILLALVVIFVMFVVLQVQNLASDMTDERIEGASRMAEALFSDIEERYMLIAQLTAGSGLVIDNMLDWNAHWEASPPISDEERITDDIPARQELFAYFTQMKREHNADGFVIRDKNFRILLRSHAPDNWGDIDASGASRVVMERGESSTAFNSTGTMPLGMSTQVPIKHEGQIIGSVTVLYFLHTDAFVDEFADVLGAEVVVFGAPGGYTSVASTFTGPDGERMIGTEAVPAAHEPVLGRGERFLTTIELRGEPFYAYFMPLHHFEGHVIGMLFVGFSNLMAVSATNTLIMVMIIIGVAGLLVAAFIVWRIATGISKPIKILDEWLNLTAKQGSIVFTDEENIDLAKYDKRRDEVGAIFRAYEELIKFMNVVCDDLREIANGNLTVDVAVRGEYDLLSQELNKMVDNLNSMFGEINTATAQVASGSKQIADGSQTLAQGSTEQAASVQQLSSSIAEIAQKTKENADMAGKAAALANNIKSSAEKGNRQMDEMMNAVKDINESSQNISKVIKSIDDIAFQTNILALNAAVEAARAGQHGKGFAVVAEEVRNLAAKSAAAAKDTESLIADSMEKSGLGSKIAGETAASLVEIVSGIEESSRLVSDIATSSEEQSAGIAQINTGVDQVAQVVQQNSATAEESAAAAQEMSGQSDMLEQLISQFKLKGSGGVGHISAPATPRAPAAESLPAPAKVEFDDGFGKY